MQNILFKVFRALKADGVLYASFKNGQKETIDDKARFFNNYTKSELVSLFKQIPHASVLECWEEVTELRSLQQAWVNILCRKLVLTYEWVFQATSHCRWSRIIAGVFMGITEPNLNRYKG